MASYLETTCAHCEQLRADKTQSASLADAKATAQWTERFRPLESRTKAYLCLQSEPCWQANGAGNAIPGN